MVSFEQSCRELIDERDSCNEWKEDMCIEHKFRIQERLACTKDQVAFLKDIEKTLARIKTWHIGIQTRIKDLEAGIKILEGTR